MIQGHTSTVNAGRVGARTADADAGVLERAQADDDEYLDAVVKETLRARPPLPFVMRALKQPFPLGEYELPARTLIALNAWVLHQRPDLYPEQRRSGRSASSAGRAEHVDPVRRRGARVHRRGVRAAGDQGRPGRDPPAVSPAADDRAGRGVNRLSVQFSPRRGARVVLRERLPA
jgi:Cytochrome P450